MSSTYTPNDAINLVTQYAHGAPLAIPAPMVVDQVNSIIWRYYPWGWSIASLPATNVYQGLQGLGSPPTGGAQFTGNQQDYTITGAWFQFPINLLFNNTTNNNFGGGYVLQQTPNGLTNIGTSVTINTLLPHNLPLGGIVAGLTGTIICDDTTQTGWDGAAVTISSVTSNTQIQGTVAAPPSGSSGGSGNVNILRPIKMRMGRLDTNPPEYREMALLGNLSPELSRTAGIDTMKAVGWFSSQNFFRFDVAPQVSTGNIIQLLGEYQILPTKITAGNLSTPF